MEGDSSLLGSCDLNVWFSFGSVLNCVNLQTLCVSTSISIVLKVCLCLNVLLFFLISRKVFVVGAKWWAKQQNVEDTLLKRDADVQF